MSFDLNRSQPSAAYPTGGHISHRVSISRELETLSAQEFFQEMRRRADDIRARWDEEDRSEEQSAG
jgi:hypothetical protein